jgi:hypothetical protein
MNKSNTINNLEEALRIFWLENSQTAALNLSEKEIRLILSSEDNTFQMDKTKREQLINRLYETMHNVSLGQLLNESIKAQKIKAKELAKESQLPLDVLKKLVKDSMFPNNVPVLLLRRLLDHLGIKFIDAKKAILKTFEILQRNVMISLGNNHLRVTSRKDVLGTGTSLRRGKRPDGKELYENKESLLKYLDKLEELMRHKD